MIITVNEHKIEVPQSDVKYVNELNVDVETPTSLGPARIRVNVTTALVEEKPDAKQG